MVDVVRTRVVGGVETGRWPAVVVGDADTTGSGSGAGAFVGDGVDTGRAGRDVEVAEDVPRTGVATGVSEEGAVT